MWDKDQVAQIFIVRTLHTRISSKANSKLRKTRLVALFYKSTNLFSMQQLSGDRMFGQVGVKNPLCHSCFHGITCCTCWACMYFSNSQTSNRLCLYIQKHRWSPSARKMLYSQNYHYYFSCWAKPLWYALQDTESAYMRQTILSLHAMQ